MLEKLSDVVFDKQLYSLRYEWPIFIFLRGDLLLVFATLHESAATAFNIVRPCLPQVEVVGRDENEKLVIRPNSKSALKSWQRSPSLPFSPADWAEPKLRMVRSRYKVKRTLFV